MKKLWRHPIVRVFLIITVLQALGTGWWFGTYTLFLLGNGLTLLQANLLNTIFMTMDAILNPYTGKLADKFGQKKLFLAGQVFGFAGFLVYGLGNSFWWFAVAETIVAIGSALMSDALESWLRNTTSEEISHQALANSGTFGSLGVIPAAVLGGIIGARFGLQWPWLISAATGVIVIGLTLKLLWKLPESYGGMEEETLSVTEVFKKMLKSKPLRFAALVSFVIAAATMPFNMFWAPILKQASGQTWWLGTLWIGIAVMSALGSQWARKQANGTGVVKMILLIGVPMMFTPWANGLIPLTILFLLHEIGRGANRPIMFTYSNRHISNNSRSTANSIQSSMRTVGAATGLLLSGYLTTIMLPVQIWGVAGIGLLMLALYSWWHR